MTSPPANELSVEKNVFPKPQIPPVPRAFRPGRLEPAFRHLVEVLLMACRACLNKAVMIFRAQTSSVHSEFSIMATPFCSVTLSFSHKILPFANHGDIYHHNNYQVRVEFGPACDFTNCVTPLDRVERGYELPTLPKNCVVFGGHLCRPLPLSIASFSFPAP